MKANWKKISLLGAAPLVAGCLALTFGLTKPATAQQGGDTPDTGAVSEPFEASMEAGTRVQTNMALFARGAKPRNARTAIDVLVRLAGPVGNESVRKQFVIPHVLESTGTIKRLAIVQTGGNFDIYLDDVLVESQALKGLPPGEPVIGTLFNIQTVVFDKSGGTPIFMETTQVNDPVGHLVALKHHELSGNVTLYK
ncbi:MAG: hypothetical protein JSS65_04875 [Armatimonadetes bacterium]|nr:hypothetical protein [Armatimonadota bacterium]